MIFKIGHIKFLICREKDIKINNYNDLNLWKADFSYGYKLEELTEEQICKKSELLVPIIYFEKYFPDKDAVDKSLIFVQVPTTGKCLPTFYLLNKKFAVTKYRFGLISFFLIVLSYWTKTIRRFRYVFDTMMSSKH
jgi:hypothetical protein